MPMELQRLEDVRLARMKKRWGRMRAKTEMRTGVAGHQGQLHHRLVRHECHFCCWIQDSLSSNSSSSSESIFLFFPLTVHKTLP